MARKRKLPKNSLAVILLGLIVILVVGVLLYLYSNFQPQAHTQSIYFFKNGNLAKVSRPFKINLPPLENAIKALLTGPNPNESLQGITTQIPGGTRLLNVKVDAKTAILNFSRQLENYGGGTDRLKGIIQQIVFTATETPGINQAWIWMEGQKELVFGGEGLVLDHPLSRGNFAN